VIVEGTMCKTVFSGKFIDLFTVVFTLFTSGYFHLHAELLSIAHPQCLWFVSFAPEIDASEDIER
jgi:hypothetical protein